MNVKHSIAQAPGKTSTERIRPAGGAIGAKREVRRTEHRHSEGKQMAGQALDFFSPGGVARILWQYKLWSSI